MPLMSLLQGTVHSLCHLEGMCWLQAPWSPSSEHCWERWWGPFWCAGVDFGGCPPPQKERAGVLLLAELLHAEKK